MQVAREAASVGGTYHNCDFILGSSAEIERVWSMAEKLMHKSRYSTAPNLLEAILFLKYNKDYWDLSMVASAVRLVKEENSETRYEKIEADAMDEFLADED